MVEEGEVYGVSEIAELLGTQGELDAGVDLLEVVEILLVRR